METFKSRDQAWAGVLNGAMFVVLGSAFPAFAVWAIAKDGAAFTSGLHQMTATELAQGVVFLVGSLFILRTGLRLLWMHIGELSGGKFTSDNQP